MRSKKAHNDEIVKPNKRNLFLIARGSVLNFVDRKSTTKIIANKLIGGNNKNVEKN